jgi:DNA repair protein RecN (Recombination protein N)
MLCRLTIRDFVLVDRLELDFQPGFGTLTGETGAGKSILVDALAFALGERADVGLIRTGCERAEVNAEFDLAGVPAAVNWLQAHDLDTQGVLLLRRVVDANGRSRAYLNGSPVPPSSSCVRSLSRWSTFMASMPISRCCAAKRSVLCSMRMPGCNRCWRKSLSPGVDWRAARALLDAASSGLEALGRRA